jgi:hypothetical protein
MWAGKVEYWHIGDLNVSSASDALSEIELGIEALIRRLYDSKADSNLQPLLGPRQHRKTSELYPSFASQERARISSFSCFALNVACPVSCHHRWSQPQNRR